MQLSSSHNLTTRSLIASCSIASIRSRRSRIIASQHRASLPLQPHLQLPLHAATTVARSPLNNRSEQRRRQHSLLHCILPTTAVATIGHSSKQRLYCLLPPLFPVAIFVIMATPMSVVNTTPRTVIARRTNTRYPASPLALLIRCCRPLLVEPSTFVVAPSVAYNPCSRRLSCLAYHSHRGRFPHQCHFLLDPLLLPETTLPASSSNNAPSAIAHSHCDIILAAITILITSSSALCRATSRVAFPSYRSSHTTLSLAAHRQKQAAIFHPCNDQNKATSSPQPLPSSSFADCTNTIAPIPMQQP
ncbi:hypothetical protein B296_00052420 [Ensete ventricosum]|uniref:Uncharacterized protein n=1 Tax=Ensete ventricosum TaxID=4639 RepID=A0A426XFL6_ENSVE|nr:hypothetical protein B296_00052420 [Ensete ventricosum]